MKRQIILKLLGQFAFLGDAPYDIMGESTPALIDNSVDRFRRAIRFETEAIQWTAV